VERSTAEHEAAHVVVGLAVGARLKRATVRPVVLDVGPADGYAWFDVWEGGPADILIVAAGVAYERYAGNLTFARYDLDALKEIGVKGVALREAERAAWAILNTRWPAHELIVDALVDGDLTHRKVSQLVLRAASKM
jgi:hypothetical protein